MQASSDRHKFRAALGRFTTGVTIVTTRAPDGTPVGLTVNSFNSVSLEPPMVLWSLAKSSRCLPAFDANTYWAVHILSVDQQQLSNRFSTSGEDKFGGVECETGLGDVPLIPRCAARMQCKTAFRYEGGDHFIFVGEVLDFDQSDVAAPLAFQAGKYVVAARKTEALSLSRAPTPPEAGFSENFINYLLGRAYFQFFAPIRQHLRQLGLSEDEYYILAVLMIKEGRTISEMNALFSYTGHEATPQAIGRLREKGYIRGARDSESAGFYLAGKARESVLGILAAAQAREAEVSEKLGRLEMGTLKNLLKGFILETNPGLPDPWAD